MTTQRVLLVVSKRRNWRGIRVDWVRAVTYRSIPCVEEDDTCRTGRLEYRPCRSCIYRSIRVGHSEETESRGKAYDDLPFESHADLPTSETDIFLFGRRNIGGILRPVEEASE